MTSRRITTTTTEEPSSEATTNDHTLVLKVFTNGTTGPGHQPWTTSQITTLWKTLEPFANVYLPLMEPDRYAILHYKDHELTLARIQPLRRLQINGCDVYVHTIPFPPMNTMQAHSILPYTEWKMTIPRAWFVQKTHYTDGLGQPVTTANPSFWQLYPFMHPLASTQAWVTIDNKDEIYLPPWPLKQCSAGLQ